LKAAEPAGLIEKDYKLDLRSAESRLQDAPNDAGEKGSRSDQWTLDNSGAAAR
jgi:hypothetical protein